MQCKFLHPVHWWAADRSLACPQGARCMEEECTTLRHPKERDTRLRLAREQRELAEQDNAVPAVPTPVKRGGGVSGADANAIGAKQAPPPAPMKTKSREQREKDRQKAGFTILSCRDTFIKRLLAERVVIITAGML